MEDKFLSSKSILSRMSLCSYFVNSKIYLFTCKKIAFMSSTEMIIPFRIIFLRLRHEKNVFCGINFWDVGILWKKCGIYFRDPIVLTNFFQSSLKKKKNFKEMRILFFRLALKAYFPELILAIDLSKPAFWGAIGVTSDDWIDKTIWYHYLSRTVSG